MNRLVAAALAFAALAPTLALADGHLPDLDGREIVIATENAYPPLQFVDPVTGDPVGWEYDAMEIIAARLNADITYETISWDAMIAAVAEGQFDMGMTGITIREDRAEMTESELAGTWRLILDMGCTRSSSAVYAHAAREGVLGLAVEELRTGSPADWVSIARNPSDAAFARQARRKFLP